MYKQILLFTLLLISGTITHATEKYAIGMFHFNLQYVAGDYRIERRIIQESFYPVLQFFDKNPQFKSDIEVQGYAIEVFAKEYPEVFKLFKKLINRGQLELVIAHYSDQFFIAYPELDLKKSIEISDRILAENGLKRSKVFFGQEIQWTPAYASALKGAYDLVVTSSDPHGYYRGKTLPLVNVRYGKDQILGLIGGGDKKLDGLEWDWAFLDDGEEFNSLDYKSDFYRVPEQEKASIDQYKKLLANGYKFVTMTELAAKIKNLKGYNIPDYPFVPEGTWNMSVCGPFMWMGRQRSGVETDGITRAISYELRGEVMMAEKLINHFAANAISTPELKKLIEEAWQHLLLSEVSDASGWTPMMVEVKYTEIEADQTRKKLSAIFERLKDLIPAGKTWQLNTKNGEVKESDSKVASPASSALLPIPLAVKAEKFTTEVRKINENLYCLELQCVRPADGAVEIIFDTPTSGLWYSAGTGEEIAVEIPTDLKNNPALALSNGYTYLNNGYSLVKDCSVEHLAATWRQKEQKLVFREELNPNNPGMKMRFYVVKGDRNAGLAFANALNTWPSYEVKSINKQLKFNKITPQ